MIEITAKPAERVKSTVKLQIISTSRLAIP
jgi:hypothetical protein